LFFEIKSLLLCMKFFWFITLIFELFNLYGCICWSASTPSLEAWIDVRNVVSCATSLWKDMGALGSLPWNQHCKRFDWAGSSSRKTHLLSGPLFFVLASLRCCALMGASRSVESRENRRWSWVTAVHCTTALLWACDSHLGTRWTQHQESVRTTGKTLLMENVTHFILADFLEWASVSLQTAEWLFPPCRGLALRSLDRGFPRCSVAGTHASREMSQHCASSHRPKVEKENDLLF